MRMKSLAVVLIAAPFLLVGPVGTGKAAEATKPLASLFSVVGDFPLGARTSRTDYESIDAPARRLYLSGMGAGQVLVFDVEKNTLVARLDGFPKVTGVLAVPELHKVYASVPGAGLVPSLFVGLGMAGLSSGHGAVAVRDTRTLKEVARVPGGVFPDGITYDAQDQKIFVSDELGSALTVIDALADKPVARIKTGGEVGNVRYDAHSRNIYVPDQSHDELLVIDPERQTVLRRFALRGGDHPHGLIVSPRAAIGYAACDGNDRLLTVDLATGHVLSNLPVAHDPDVLSIDPGNNRLYVASESGGLSTYNIAAAASPVPLGDVFVGKDAHTVAVDPISHRLYLSLADNGHGQSVLRVLQPKPA